MHFDYGELHPRRRLQYHHHFHISWRDNDYIDKLLSITKFPLNLNVKS